MSDTITDVFAFAAKHRDYWAEILDGDQSYDNVLSGDEVKAFDAARVHIGESIYSLFKVCGDELTKRAAADGHPFPIPRFQKEKARQNRRVNVVTRATNPGKLYGAFFSLEGDSNTGTIRLYASISVYKEIIETVKRTLQDAKIEFQEYEGYYLYAPGIALDQGKSLTEIASKAAENLWNLLKYVK